MRRTLLAAVLGITWLHAQAASRSPLDPAAWGVVYEVPGMSEARVESDVPYLSDPRGTLTLDLYHPKSASAGERRPAVVFLNGIGDRPDGKVKHWAIYESWARLVAASGFVGISMDADATRIPDCLREVFAWLGAHGAEHGVDATRLGVYAASANVTAAADYLFGDKASPGIRAAALYYGAPPQAPPRADLPVFFVVAASDAPGQGAPLERLWGRVLDAKAPWTLTFGAGLPHAFDAFADEEASRRIVRQTIEFWRAHLDTAAPVAPAAPVPEARRILAAIYGRDSERAVQLLTAWVASHADDAAAHAQLGMALLDLHRWEDALRELGDAVTLGAGDPGLYQALARAAMGLKRWGDVLRHLDSAVAAGLDTSLGRGMRGAAELQLGRNQEAARSYERAFEIGIPPGPGTRGVAAYNLACAYARLGDKDRAFAFLTQAAQEGSGERDFWDSDPDLEALRGDPRYAAIVSKFPANAARP